MRLLGAEIQGFRSFAAAQSIRFDTMRPGLYHVAGRNEVEPELQANGAGKSSLFKAIFWGLFGEDDEGLRGGSLKNWNSKLQQSVILDVLTAAGRIGVLRTYGPNILEVIDGDKDPEPVDDEQLTGGLGMAPAAFLFSMYFAQFAPTFVDLRPGEQLEIFTSILQLEVWENAAKQATASATEAERNVQLWREEIARLQGQVEELLSKSYEEDEKTWEKLRTAGLRIMSDKIKQCRTAFGQAQIRVSQAKKGCEKFTEHHVRASTAEAAYKLVEVEHARQSRAVVSLQRDDIKTCPECGAPVTREHVKKELQKALAELKRLDDDLVKKRAVLDKEIAKRDEYQPQQDALVAAEREHATAQAELRSAERELARIQADTNPYTALKLEADQRGEEIVTQLEHAQQQLDAAERAVKAAQFWVKGFKEIRLGLIRDSLAQLTLEANEVLFQLGLQDWSIEFDVERETKSKTISKGFTTLVKAPRATQGVPFKAYCGGEKQRLRLSIMMGVANLISSRAGVAPNVEFWDEPSQGLSGAGIDDLLAVLADRAQRYGKVILLADHRALDFGGFAGTITVVKDQNGSRIEI